MTTPTAAVPSKHRPAQPGEALTRRAVTAVTAAIVVMTFAFSLGNVTQLCLDLGITAWIAWLVGPAVDLSVVGLLTGMRFLSLHGYTDAQLARLQPHAAVLRPADPGPEHRRRASATASTAPPWSTRSARRC